MTLADLHSALPELIVLLLASTVLLLDLYIDPRRRGMLHLISLLGLLFAAMTTFGDLTPVDKAQHLFSGTVVRDRLGDVLKLFAYIVTAMIFVYAKHYLRVFKLFRGEFHALVLFVLLGALVLISAASLVTVYLGLELIALSSYALVAFNRDLPRCSEAAMKYFILGSLASGLLLYGMSLLYGLSGSLELASISAASLWGDQWIATFALVFIITGIAFKLGAAPFHLWVPDVYHGAPAAVTLLLSSLPKLAAFAMAYRLLHDALAPLLAQWQGMLVIVAALSIILGNLVAIAQSNIKRMLAYSTISHMGFLLLGVLAGSPAGFSAAMFYAVIYALMSAGAFGIVILLSGHGIEAENLDDFKGLNQRHPWYAFMMLLLMASMAGIPVLAGFFAKWLVIQAVLDAGFTWLAILALIFSVVGAYYYLRVVKLMYFDDPRSEQAVTAPADFRVILSANGLAQLAIGLFPGPLIALCTAVFAG